MREEDSPKGQRALLLFGCALWVLALLLTWPTGLSFQDEVGYVGQTRLLLEGGIRPLADSPGFWSATETGHLAKYPLFPSLVLVPLFAMAPVASFAFGALPALLLAGLAARILAFRRVETGLALAVLAHPTVVLMSRTAMPDLMLALAAVGSWWALRRGHRWAAAGLLALTVLLKPTGLLVAAPLLLGEVLRGSGGKGRKRAAIDCVIPAIGLAAGLLIVGLLNVLQTDGPGYGYVTAHAGLTQFTPVHFLDSGLRHLATLLLAPPLLLLGVLPWWRRREWGVLMSLTAIVVGMSCYFFVDVGRSFIDTLVLSPRLILPAVVFLLLGYLELIGRLLGNGRVARCLICLLLLAAPALAYTLGTEHLEWQRPMTRARDAAESRMEQSEGDALGLTFSAFKAGLLTRHRVVWVRRTKEKVPVILCSTEVPTYREASPPMPCQFEGYRLVERPGPYRILVGD